MLEIAEQFEALKSSAANYDNGNLWESKRLATTVHTLVHDGSNGNSRSILKQLGIKGELSFLTCAQPPDKPGIQTLSILKGMCGISETDNGPMYHPVLDRAFNRRHVTFQHWWDEVLFTNKSNVDIARKNLVFSLRSQDGGSHFDKSLPDDAYLSLKGAKDTGMWAFSGNGPYNIADAIPIKHGHLAIMRQVSFELIETLSPILHGHSGDS